MFRRLAALASTLFVVLPATALAVWGGEEDTAHPSVGAIMHVHAWVDGVAATEINFPCGTAELAVAVADLIRAAEDPGHAVVGLKNHGLTITGSSLDEIFERVGPHLVRNVPMT